MTPQSGEVTNPPPDKPAEAAPIHLTLVATNDQHGWVMPQIEKFGGAHIRAGGSALMATYVKAKMQLSLAGYFVGRQDASTFLTDTAFGNSLLLPNHNLGPGYQKFDASGAYRLHPRLRAYVSVENVGNERYEAALGYPALPRSVRTGLSVTLGGDSAKRP